MDHGPSESAFHELSYDVSLEPLRARLSRSGVKTEVWRGEILVDFSRSSRDSRLLARVLGVSAENEIASAPTEIILRT